MDNLRSSKDAVSQRRLWEAESEWNQSSSRRDVALQRLKTVGLNDSQLDGLADSRTLIATLPVRSPIDGLIMDFDKVLGHVVRPEESLFEVHDLSQPRVKGFVSERDFQRVSIGQPVRIQFVADASEVVTGILVRSGSSIGRDDRTLSVWADLTQMPQVPVQHNMMARLIIETGQIPPQLTVPLGAIVREGTRSYVFAQSDDGTFERRFVQLGRSDDTAIEVIDGLSNGESVAVNGSAQLQSAYAALR
jgi:RND family efflux transporter MFP subunit